MHPTAHAPYSGDPVTPSLKKQTQQPKTHKPIHKPMNFLSKTSTVAILVIIAIACIVWFGLKTSKKNTAANKNTGKNNGKNNTNKNNTSGTAAEE